MSPLSFSSTLPLLRHRLSSSLEVSQAFQFNSQDVTIQQSSPYDVAVFVAPSSSLSSLLPSPSFVIATFIFLLLGVFSSFQAAKLETTDMNSNECSTNLWVFGYGSLCWLQGFDFGNHQLGFIRGFSRRFWQGNNSHRGTNDKPGRVATLVKEDESITWGLAFELLGEMALRYLNDRECTKGGYETLFTTFFPRNGVMAPFPVLVYRATEHNPQWLGPAPLADVAAQVTQCKGEAGHNSEYVLRLADFFRDNLPEVHDEDLFTLERLVLKQMKEKNISSLEDVPVAQVKQEAISIAVAGQPENNPDQEVRRDSFLYLSRVPSSKKLLCLKV